MALTLSCLDLGSSCDVTVSGNSVDEIIAEMCRHAVEAHNERYEKMNSDEVQAAMRAAIRQSTRPAHLRTSKLDF